MTIYIPVWVLWTLGGIGGLIIIGFAALGICLTVMFRKIDFRLNW